MERREHYEPEDIEVLLNERAFDELLPEEQAFVLRHLSGREEYEHMRTMLHHLREEERGHGTITADPGIRTAVMNTFREQQVPVWRIWLNSIKVFLLPDHVSAFWRPALALATVVLLVVGVVNWRGGSMDERKQLAELQPTEQPVPKALSAITEHKAANELEDKQATTGTGYATTSNTKTLNAERGTLFAADNATTTDKLAEGLADLKAGWNVSADMAAEAPLEEAEFDYSASPAPASASGVFGATTMDTMLVADERLNYVQREDFVKNATMANAAGEVTMQEVSVVSLEKAGRDRKKVAEKELDGATANSRSLKEDQQLIELLNSAW